MLVEKPAFTNEDSGAFNPQHGRRDHSNSVGKLQTEPEAHD